MLNITHTISSYCGSVREPGTGLSGVEIVDNFAVATEPNWGTGSAASEGRSAADVAISLSCNTCMEVDTITGVIKL